MRASFWGLKRLLRHYNFGAPDFSELATDILELKNNCWHSKKIFSNKNQLLRCLRISSVYSKSVPELHFLSFSINKYNETRLHPFHYLRSLEQDEAFHHWFQTQRLIVFLGISAFFIYITGFEILKKIGLLKRKIAFTSNTVEPK